MIRGTIAVGMALCIALAAGFVIQTTIESNRQLAAAKEQCKKMGGTTVKRLYTYSETPPFICYNETLIGEVK